MPDGCDSVYCHSHTQSDDVFIYTAAELTMRGDINENVQFQHWVKKKKKEVSVCIPIDTVKNSPTAQVILHVCASF